MHTTRGEAITHLTQPRTLWSTIATCLVVSVCNSDTDVKGTASHLLIWFIVLHLHIMEFIFGNVNGAKNLWLSRLLVLG